jgi:tripartite-type tricarboxylate transporter receptor subunit TctC
MLGRAGTPEPILRRMAEAMAQTLSTPEVRNKLEEQGADVVSSGPERTRRFLNAEIQKWGQVIRDNNITAES